MKARFVRLFCGAMIFGACLSACGSLSGSTAIPPLYSWESYETQVYAYLKGESGEAQLPALERDREKIEVSGKSPPPGFYAQMGLLYAETGDRARAIACFTAEKTRFPEAGAYMDFLLERYGE